MNENAFLIFQKISLKAVFDFRYHQDILDIFGIDVVGKYSKPGRRLLLMTTLKRPMTTLKRSMTTLKLSMTNFKTVNISIGEI